MFLIDNLCRLIIQPSYFDSSVRTLRAVEEQITRNGGTFDMQTSDNCIAGNLYRMDHSLESSGAWWRTRANVVNKLHLTEWQAGRLCFVTRWPESFQKEYWLATSSAARALVANRRIEHFIKTRFAE